MKQGQEKETGEAMSVLQGLEEKNPVREKKKKGKKKI